MNQTPSAKTSPQKFMVITVSDRATRGEREDASGPRVRELLAEKFPAADIQTRLVADEQDCIEAMLIAGCDEDSCALIITTGGTGLAPRDVTPEATRKIIDREIPGMAEAMRAAGMHKTPHAMLSRGICGQRGSTLMVNLSGNPRAVSEQLAVLLPVLPHALSLAQDKVDDCGSLRAPTGSRLL